MKYILSLLFFLSIISSCCEKENMKCICRSLEECIDGQCVLRANSFYLWNREIIGKNLYHGFLAKEFCTDTILIDVAGDGVFFIDINLKSEIGHGSFIYSKEIIKDKEYNISILPSEYLLCQGKYFSFMHCSIYKDSLNLDLYLREEDGGGKTDTVFLTLIK